MAAVENEKPDTSTIVLSRGDTGLGFNIRGGVDNPHIPGDTGIFVTKIREQGAAFRDGRLKEGDKILEINGNNLVGVTHEAAVQNFTKAKETVTLKVEHGAQEKILKKRAEERENKKTQKASGGNSTFKYVTLAAVVIGLGVGGFFVFKRFQPSRFTSYR